MGLLGWMPKHWHAKILATTWWANKFAHINHVLPKSWQVFCSTFGLPKLGHTKKLTSNQ
jgi:hypothetical protein